MSHLKARYVLEDHSLWDVTFGFCITNPFGPDVLIHQILVEKLFYNNKKIWFSKKLSWLCVGDKFQQLLALYTLAKL